MKLSDKIIKLRKENGWSQENLAEKLNVSRQTISRWESAAAQPDAGNILQLSKLFGVTADYLLDDEYGMNHVPTKENIPNNDGLCQIMTFILTLEVMILIIQFMTTFVLQNVFFAMLSFVPFVAVIGGFEYAYKKNASQSNENIRKFRKKFYKISTWLGAYFPIRFLMQTAASFYPRPYQMIVLECMILAIYLMAVTFITLQIEKADLQK